MESLRDRELAADRAFSTMSILSESPTSLLLGRSDDSNMITEFILGQWGTLVIHGDGPDLIVCSRSSFPSVRHAIRWVARNWLSKQYAYVTEKTVAGETHTFSVDEAKAQLTARLMDDIRDHNNWAAEGECIPLDPDTIWEQDLECYDIEDTRRPMVALASLITGLHEEMTQDDIYRTLGSELDGDTMSDLYGDRLGDAPASNLINAMAACARAVACMEVQKE